MTKTQFLIPLAEGTMVRYEYPQGGQTVTVEGRKGRAINPGYNAGFEIVDESGAVVARIARTARVTVIA
jgi:hypothetical protein